MTSSSTTAPHLTGTYPTFPIVIRVLEARNLKLPTQRDHTVDPYVVVSFKKGILKMMSSDKEGRFQSRILEDTLNPVWNEEFVLHPSKPETAWIVVKVYDRDRVGKKDTLLGKFKLHIVDFWNKGLVDRWFPLETTFSKTGHGEIHLLVNYNESGQMKPTQMTSQMGQGITSGIAPDQNMMKGVTTGSGFPSDTSTSQTGFVQSSTTYPPPLGTHDNPKTF